MLADYTDYYTIQLHIYLDFWSILHFSLIWRLLTFGVLYFEFILKKEKGSGPVIWYKYLERILEAYLTAYSEQNKK